MMNEILNYLLESLLIFSVIMLFYQLILEKEKCYHFNRYYILIMPLFALILPLIHIQINPTNPVASIVFPDNLIFLPEVIISPETVIRDSSSTINWNHIIIGVYLIGFLYFSFKFLYRIGRIGLMLYKYRNQFIKLDGYYLAHTHGEFPTYSFFNYIFWDQTRSLSDNEKKQILEHELKHVRDIHSLDLIYLNILSVILWFNPFVHLLLIKAGDVHEYIADDTVVHRVDRSDYMSLLAKMALNRVYLPVPSFFDRSRTLKRIEKMKSQKQNTNILKLLAIIPVIGIIFLVFACQDNSSESSKITSLDEKKQGELSEPSVSMHDGDKNQLIISDDEIMEIVDIQPTPVDGFQAFYTAIVKELKYPKEAKENSIQGRVLIEFVIDKEGNVRNVKTLKGISHGCDVEAERVLNTIDVKWNPGIHDNKKVNCRMVIPITFKLS